MVPQLGHLWALQLKRDQTAVAMLHELVHAHEELVCAVHSSSLFAHEVWEAPDLFVICASQGRRTAVVAPSGAESSTWESEPNASAHWVRDHGLEFVEYVRVGKVLATSFFCEIIFEGLDPCVMDRLRQSSGSAEDVHEEGARDQAEINQHCLGVSA